METIDCRNLSCPAPVINVKKALQEHSEIRVLLDDGAPRENVTRFSRNRGCRVSEERDGSGWVLTISGSAGTVHPDPEAASQGSRVVMITSDRLGDGPEELGRLLMRNFVHTLLETAELPARMLFLNTRRFSDLRRVGCPRGTWKTARHGCGDIFLRPVSRFLHYQGQAAGRGHHKHARHCRIPAVRRLRDKALVIQIVLDSFQRSYLIVIPF